MLWLGIGAEGLWSTLLSGLTPWPGVKGFLVLWSGVSAEGFLVLSVEGLWSSLLSDLTPWLWWGVTRTEGSLVL